MSSPLAEAELPSSPSATSVSSGFGGWSLAENCGEMLVDQGQNTVRFRSKDYEVMVLPKVRTRFMKTCGQGSGAQKPS